MEREVSHLKKRRAMNSVCSMSNGGISNIWGRSQSQMASRISGEHGFIL
jgi:hypothetical protein